MKSKSEKSRSVLLGAAFLMATSSIGPGFLTQTTQFTAQYLSSFAFVILCVIFMDIIAQWNVWSVIGATGLRGQEVANRVLPGLGVFLSLLVAIGGLVFNIGNVGGVSLGLNALAGVPEKIGCLMSGAFAICIFLSKNGKGLMDKVSQILGTVIIITMLIMCFLSRPPIGEALYRSVVPDNPQNLVSPMLTLLGGSCGGYIMFSGAHRLLDNGYGGVSDVKEFRRSCLLGIGVSSAVRILLFLTVLGVCVSGGTLLTDNINAILSSDNPAGEAFYLAAGAWGLRLFGLVAAGTTCVIGAAYTSVSFLKTLHPSIAAHERGVIVGFIAFSTAVMTLLGGAKGMVIVAGAINGLILPISLCCILLACHKKDIVGPEYRRNKWMEALGWFVVLLSGALAIKTLPNLLTLFRG